MPTTTMRKFVIQTPDGTCPIYLHMGTSANNNALPAIIMYMDGPGIRPAIHEIAARLAGEGYAVALPDLFYRGGAYEPVHVKAVWNDPERKAAHRANFMETATPSGVMADTKELIAALDRIEEIDASRIGVVGYCMGGRLALVAAATFPDRVAVAASYHGGGLATTKPDSPHLLAYRIRGRIYVAGAMADSNFNDEQKSVLETALTNAGVAHVVETYPAKHGWVPRDMPAHDAEQAERHWQTLVPLMDNVLQSQA
ncbi:dienelactone hydrolase family protein [Stakelama sp. CBK3Z-3]|uniref:Dienelactone hydrolase family protein n=1 Tax=Stakelama flava TaxID=2860338 RepID=A0ABS6XPH7_9SPHN|nr:dienelactone hydrolase family protein [Stakelama flava]MBW4332125.1 dienelactone hydrolase family protein [Stakelama flava]